MSRFVLDTALAMAWFFADEAKNEYPVAVLTGMEQHTALVPAIWPLEVTNVLLTGIRRKRCTAAEAARFLVLLRALPIKVDDRTAEQAFITSFTLAQEFGLSSYDAAFLELAMREGIPMATLDKQLANAAILAGVPVFVP